MPKIDPNFLEDVKEEFYNSEDQNSKRACVLISCKPAHEELKALCENEPVNYKHLIYKKHLKKIGYAIFLSHKYPLSFISFYILKNSYSYLNDLHQFFNKLHRSERKELYKGFHHANPTTKTWTVFERVSRYRIWKLLFTSTFPEKDYDRIKDVDLSTIKIPKRCEKCPLNKLMFQKIPYCDGGYNLDFHFYYKTGRCPKTEGSE